MKNIAIDVEDQAQNVINISFLNKRTNKKDKSKFETILETLYQQHSIKLSKVVACDIDSLECQNFEHYQSNTFLRKPREGTKPL